MRNRRRDGPPDTAARGCPAGEGERNKANVVAFYDLMLNECCPAEAAQRFLSPGYVQHNPHVDTGRERFVAYFERMAREYPGKRVEFGRVLADGDCVVLHCFQSWPSDRDYAGIDSWRVAPSGRIVAHWGVLQAMPERSANSNGMLRADRPTPRPCAGCHAVDGWAVGGPRAAHRTGATQREDAYAAPAQDGRSDRLAPPERESVGEKTSHGMAGWSVCGGVK